MSFFPILHYIFNTWCCLSTTYMIPKCLNTCIIASSFSGVHLGCLAFSDLARLKFSPTSNPHFFLICAIYSDETLSPVCSSTYAFIYSYVAFPLNSDKSISSREKSTFTFLLSTILRSTSVRAEQRSTGPLAPLESKTTVSTWHDTFWLMSGIVPVRGNISNQNGNRSTPLTLRIRRCKQMQSVAKLTSISRS